MKLSQLIPTVEQFKLIQGKEGELIRRRRIGAISGFIALIWAIIQILLATETDYIKNIGEFITNLLSGNWEQLEKIVDKISTQEFAGILVLVIALGIYFIFRWTSFLLKESQEPFRYTFSIEPFNRVDNTPDNRFTLQNAEQFKLLDHDVKERLNQRIKRFSLLNVKDETSTSHIHITGDYAIREDTKGKWVIHVMPRVRIGPPGRPETLANSVKYPLAETKENKKTSNNNSKTEHPITEKLEADRYNQIVERVYSSIATEIYRQIESDVKGKINLFPTDYMKALALFHEAEDFARSNTIDAYDRAIELYEDARRYFDITNDIGMTNIKSIHLQAKIKIGHAKCLVYKRLISALSGRYKNSLFEIPIELNQVIMNLTKLNDNIVAKWKLEPNKEDSKQRRLNTLPCCLT